MFLSPVDRELAEKLFHATHHWFCEIPWLRANRQPDALFEKEGMYEGVVVQGNCCHNI
jgi:hypothetical protein